jgi:hypothetical protein
MPSSARTAGRSPSLQVQVVGVLHAQVLDMASELEEEVRCGFFGQPLLGLMFSDRFRPLLLDVGNEAVELLHVRQNLWVLHLTVELSTRIC